MPHQVMFVCAMNVCRSPLMAFTFQEAFTFAEALATESDRTGLTVTSRGTLVSHPDPMCDISASVIAQGESGREFAEAHRSAPLVSAELESQDLILVASRAERAKIAQMSPGLRSRTFTVREALALGAPATTSADLELVARSRDPHEKLRLGGYAQLLHQRRGTVAMPSSRQLPWKRVAIDPIDIPDVHHRRRPQHVATLRAAQEDVRNLHGQIRRFLSAGTVAHG